MTVGIIFLKKNYLNTKIAVKGKKRVFFRCPMTKRHVERDAGAVVSFFSDFFGQWMRDTWQKC